MADRLRTNAEIDYLNQFVKEGETKIPYELNADGTPIAAQLTEEQKLEAEQKQKAQEEADKATEEEKKKIIAAEEEKNKTAAPAANTIETELDDEKILAYFKNKKGKEITSLEELLNPKKEQTEEEKQAEKEKRDSNKFAFGLQKGIFSKKELESFISDTANPQGLVFAAYAANQKLLDPELTDEEIKDEFEDKFSLNEEVDSRKHKAGQLLLNNIAGKLINDRHSKILNLENDYTAFESSTANQNAQTAKIQSQTPIYQRDVEQIRSEVGKISLKMANDEVFETTLPESIVNETISKLLAPEQIERQINKGWTKEEIKQVAQTTAILQNLPTIMQEYADKQVLKKQAGLRGIPPNNERRGRIIPEGELSENQKKAQDHYKSVLNIPVQAGAN